MNITEFEKELTRFTQKRKFESAIFYGFILFVGVLFILQINGLLLSTYGVTTILMINIITILNISGRSTALNHSIRTFYRLRFLSSKKSNDFTKLYDDLDRDIGEPLQNEIKLNMYLLYSVGVLAAICSVVVIVDAASGQFRIYKYDQWVNNTVYFGYFLLLMILYRVMFLSEKRYGKVQIQFVEYIKKLTA